MSGDRELETAELSPAALELRAYGNIGIAYTYNEPLVGYEYVRDCAALLLAQEAPAENHNQPDHRADQHAAVCGQNRLIHHEYTDGPRQDAGPHKNQEFSPFRGNLRSSQRPVQSFFGISGPQRLCISWPPPVGTADGILH